MLTAPSVIRSVCNPLGRFSAPARPGHARSCPGGGGATAAPIRRHRPRPAAVSGRRARPCRHRASASPGLRGRGGRFRATLPPYSLTPSFAKLRAATNRIAGIFNRRTPALPLAGSGIPPNSLSQREFRRIFSNLRGETRTSCPLLSRAQSATPQIAGFIT